MGDAVRELNKFLKGIYMGIHSYENLIQNEQNPNIKQELQRMQQDHKNNAAKVAERIQNLGGTPVTDEGIIGSAQNFISGLTTPTETDSILRDALKGEEYYAMEVSRKEIVGDIDEESKQLIDDILEKEKEHVNTLRAYLG